jgi:hypothetical protein
LYLQKSELPVPHFLTGIQWREESQQGEEGRRQRTGDKIGAVTSMEYLHTDSFEAHDHLEALM